MRSGDDQGVVEPSNRVSPALSLERVRQEKLIAANVDQIVIVVATEPSFSDELVARSLAAESQEKDR